LLILRLELVLVELPFATSKSYLWRNTTFSIPDFTATLNAVNGLLRNNKYICRVNAPAILIGSQDAQIVEFLCDSSSIPAVALATADIRRYGYGAVEKKPYAPLFTDVNMTFMMDGMSKTYNFLYDWISLIINYRFTNDQDAAGGITSTTGILPNQHPYELAYKDDYATTIQLMLFDPTAPDVPNLQVNLRDAYPTFLGDLPLNWASTDPYIKIPVTFTFMDWYVQTGKQA